MSQKGFKPGQLKKSNNPGAVAEQLDKIMQLLQEVLIKLDSDAGVDDVDYEDEFKDRLKF